MPRHRMRYRNPEDELPYDEWIPAHAVRFNADGTVSLMAEGGEALSNPYLWAWNSGRRRNPDLRGRLEHAVTEYDRKQSEKPGYNPYALPQYLAAVDDAINEIDRGVPVEEALEDNFSDRLLTAVLRAA